MTTTNSIPFFELKFDKDARLTDLAELEAIESTLQSGSYTDILVVSHGWNNDLSEARELYNSLLQLVHDEIKVHPIKDRSFISIGIFWPAKKFSHNDQKNGSAAALNNKSGTANAIELCHELDEFINTPTARIALKNIIDSIDKKSPEPKELATQFMNLYQSISSNENNTMDEDALKYYDIENMTRILEDPDFLETGEIPEPGMGGATSIFNGMINGINNLLNLATYYQMKERAGLIGVQGLNPILKRIKLIGDGKIHLAGHSFGARLMSAAISGNTAVSPIQVQSLSLMQAAFSHYGFAEKYEKNFDGLFRNTIVKKYVSGPIIITHTRNDKAVGIAYAIASRLANQVASAVGGKDDFYGGLGSNGAQKTPEASNGLLLNTDGSYSFTAGGVYNLKADKYIKDHSDIKKPQVAKALVAAMFT
jgi:hypothetical protein